MMQYVISAFIIAALVVFLYVSGKKRKKSVARSPYLEAVHLLLDGKRDEALEKLKRTVWTDTDNIMAYIKLGDIFREKGFAIRASKIHRNLLLRTTLNEEETQETLHHLILDYQAADMLDKAVEMAERLVHRNKKNIEFRRLLLGLYEKKEDWDKAFFMRQSVNKWIKRGDQNILALYKVNAGQAIARKGSEHQGRIRFREAIKLDKQCIPAYVCLGDSYMRENRFEDALKVWKEFAEQKPGQAHLILDRLNDVLYNLGRYDELEAVCEQIIKAKPSDPGAYFKLVDIYEKQGKTKEALALCQQVFEADPESPRGRYAYVRFLKQAGRKEAAFETALEILKKDIKKAVDFRCVYCGYASKDLFWLCPNCKNWNSLNDDKKTAVSGNGDLSKSVQENAR
jgi:lipopolysaccharide biosynthesis regulator YciM